MAERIQMPFWGWGDPAHPRELPDHAVAHLREAVGLAEHPRPPVALDAVRLSESRLPDAARGALAGVVGDAHVREDRAARVFHAAGKSYPDLVRLRAGEPAHAADAVVWPGGADEVAAVLAACAEAGVAVVPFGGGTSVVGGVEPLAGDHAAVIALDLARLRALHALDEVDETAVLGPGLRGPEAEALLAARGYTLGHFPQSYEFATVGGFVATRSAGQASTGYGRIDDNVLGVRLAAPAGEIDLPPRPASAAGPGLRDVIVGSEGTLGVITAAALAIAPRPECVRYEGWFFRSFAEGAEALRRLEQAGAAPTVARLSDEAETRLSMLLAGANGAAAKAGRAYLRARRALDGCLMIAGWEGTEREVARRRARGAFALRRAGGVALGAGPGRAWERGRYSGPYLRDVLLEHGVMVETLETATTWSNLGSLHAAVGDALSDALAARGTPPLVMCHVSHLYSSGASLYFTWLARQQEGEEIAQWRAAKTAASAAIVAGGGTITHHHAVGTDHAPWMPREIGPLGVEALRAVKDRLDPSGIMNPGKLLPAP